MRIGAVLAILLGLLLCGGMAVTEQRPIPVDNAPWDPPPRGWGNSRALVDLKADGRLLFRGRRVTLGDLPRVVRAYTNKRGWDVVYVRADDDVPLSRVALVIRRLHDAGFETVNVRNRDD